MWAWLINNPVARWVGAAILVLAGIRYAEWRVRKDAAEDERRRVLTDIEDQTHERQTDARAERDRVRDLNLEQLRKLRADDPHNRGRVQRPEGD